MTTRRETDSMGAIEVPADRYWGAQTQRSLQNFKISGERMPRLLIHALAQVKRELKIVQELNSLRPGQGFVFPIQPRSVVEPPRT